MVNTAGIYLHKLRPSSNGFANALKRTDWMTMSAIPTTNKHHSLKMPKKCFSSVS